MSTPHETSSLRERVAQVLAVEILPALQMDGTSMEVVDVSDGVVRLRWSNACGGCPSTVMAVIMGVEQELQKRIPEVAYIELSPA
jgi:Fe-S cluster biogenesis protein NfuA